MAQTISQKKKYEGTHFDFILLALDLLCLYHNPSHVCYKLKTWTPLSHRMKDKIQEWSPHPWRNGNHTWTDILSLYMKWKNIQVSECELDTTSKPSWPNTKDLVPKLWLLPMTFGLVTIQVLKSEYKTAHEHRSQGNCEVIIKLSAYREWFHQRWGKRDYQKT